MDINIEKLRIVHYPAKVLAQKAQPIEEVDDTVRALVDRMIDLMVEDRGVGLAAPQVGLSLRLFVISLDGTREQARAYINPVIKPSGNIETKEEGCLSVPGIYTKIRRYHACEVTALDVNGNKFTEKVEELHARALQHEYDHLEGITIVNRMGSAAKIAHRRQLKKLEAAIL